MSHPITTLVTDPDAEYLETSVGRCVVSAFDIGKVITFLRAADSVAEVKRDLGSVAEDASLLLVCERERRLHLFRSVTGTHRLFYCRGSGGDIVVTDHFRNALAALDAEDRSVSDSAVADHLLYRAPIAPASFVDGVRSVGQGEWHTWDLAADEQRVALVDTVSASHTAPPSEPVAALDETLTGLVETGVETEDAVNLYSGGVDSTLTQTYLGETPMVNVGIDSPEYAFEVEYAREGSERFDAPFYHRLLDESDVLDHVESSVDALGEPGMQFQTLLIDAAFRDGYGSQYVMAVGADSLWGDTEALGARLASWLSPVLRSPLGPLAPRLAPGSLGSFLGWLRTLAAEQQHPPTDPASFPQQSATYTKPELASTLLDESLVRARCRSQFESIRRRVETATSDRTFARQIEASHLLETFAQQKGSRWRQLAATHGRSLAIPFETRSMVALALSIPASRRYVQGLAHRHRLTPKHVPKRLLERRLPSYPVGRTKGAGILPFERYFSDGALADVFDRYDVPSFVSDDTYAAAVEESGRQAWNLVTYAVWRDRVLENERLEPVPTTERIEFTVAGRSRALRRSATDD